MVSFKETTVAPLEDQSAWIYSPSATKPATKLNIAPTDKAVPIMEERTIPKANMPIWVVLCLLYSLCLPTTNGYQGRSSYSTSYQMTLEVFSLLNRLFRAVSVMYWRSSSRGTSMDSDMAHNRWVEMDKNLLELASEAVFCSEPAEIRYAQSMSSRNKLVLAGIGLFSGIFSLMWWYAPEQFRGGLTVDLVSFPSLYYDGRIYWPLI